MRCRVARLWKNDRKCGQKSRWELPESEIGCNTCPKLGVTTPDQKFLVNRVDSGEWHLVASGWSGSESKKPAEATITRLPQGLRTSDLADHAFAFAGNLVL